MTVLQELWAFIETRDDVRGTQERHNSVMRHKLGTQDMDITLIQVYGETMYKNTKKVLQSLTHSHSISYRSHYTINVYWTKAGNVITLRAYARDKAITFVCRLPSLARKLSHLDI